MKQVWSCGGGVQSAAIAALIVSGRLPKPDIALIVDTEREKSTTWAYYESVLKPELAKVGVNLLRIPKSRYATVDLWDAQGRLLIPTFTNRDNKIGRTNAYCSNEWKKRVIMRYLREQGVERCQNWLGISTDEMKRVRVGDKLWFQPRYVLIYDVPMSRANCVGLVSRMGWPPAPRSSCWMCPNHDDAEWAAESTADLRLASHFEIDIQKRDPHAWLHKFCKPIATINFDSETNDDDGCQSGFCFT